MNDNLSYDTITVLIDHDGRDGLELSPAAVS